MISAPRPTPIKTRAASTKSETTSAVAFSQVRPKEPIVGARMKTPNASTLTTPAPMKSQTSVWMVANDVIARRGILAQVDDDHRNGADRGEDRRPESPAAVDVAHVVGTEVDPSEAHDHGDQEPGHEN